MVRYVLRNEKHECCERMSFRHPNEFEAASHIAKLIAKIRRPLQAIFILARKAYDVSEKVGTSKGRGRGGSGGGGGTK